MSEISSRVIGIDIGGANLKFATPCGVAHSEFFPMWSRADCLSAALTSRLQELTLRSQDPSAKVSFETLAVTMTGELADCFDDREVGVRHIVQQTVQAADQCGVGTVAFYGVDGQFHSPQDAGEQVDVIAAANWHALASYVARRFVENGLLIDIGSTTTDLIPLHKGRIATSAKTDYDRLREGSLVYVGGRRTPVCALVDTLPYKQQQVAIMNEVFATIDDAMLMLGHAAEDDSDTMTADGSPRTIDRARNRLARMIGLDHRHVTKEDASEMAKAIIFSAQQRVSEAVRQLRYEGPIILSGHGLQLASCLQGPSIELHDHLGEDAVRCAPSFAVAMLYQTLGSRSAESPSIEEGCEPLSN